MVLFSVGGFGFYGMYIDQNFSAANEPMKTVLRIAHVQCQSIYVRNFCNEPGDSTKNTVAVPVYDISNICTGFAQKNIIITSFMHYCLRAVGRRFVLLNRKKIKYR